MSANFFLYALCLLANLQRLPSARPRDWLRKVQNEKAKDTSSYESLEIMPYIAVKLADRTNNNTEKIDEKDKNKLIPLFTNNKKEVKDASEAILSEMLRVLENLVLKKNQDNGKQVNKNTNNPNIAWSYYDDLGE